MPDRVLILDYAWPDVNIERTVFEANGIELRTQTGADGELLAIAPDFDAIMVNWRTLPASVIGAAKRCRTIARFGVGIDNIDVHSATEHGIVVSRVPDFCVDEVAEHALALILALGRRIVPLADHARRGGWSNTVAGPIHRIRGSILGIVGWGATARALADRAVGIGMQVKVHSRSVHSQQLPAGVATAPSLIDLAATVDYLSVHTPLTVSTANLIDETVLRAMRPTAFLVNTARGPIVDTQALVRAVSEGWIAGAGVDVLDGDPPLPGNPLIGLDNVVVTPHAAFNSVEALQYLRSQAAHNVVDALNGQVPQSIVNPEVLNSSALRLTPAVQ